MQTELSIVIPCLNEAESLPYCLEKAGRFLLENNISGEVIVVDNGSTDDSISIAKQFDARIINETEKGYGRAVAAGMKAANGKFLIMGDADDSYDFYPLMPFLERLRDGYDLVVGNRFAGGIQKGAMPFLHQYIGNPALSFVSKLFFRSKAGDILCGLRGVTKKAFEKMELRTTGMEFCPEMIVKATLHKMKVAEVPIQLYPDKRNRASHLKTWQDGWRNLRFLLLYSPKWLFLIPGMIILLFGFLLSIFLIKSPLPIAGKKLDVHTLIYTSGCTLLGFQFITFYFFTRLYAATHGLLPFQEKFLLNFNKYFKLERGLLFGFLLIIGGIALSIRSFLFWEHIGFGNLDPMVVLRWVIPSMTLIILGVQIIISFFYLSFLTINSKQNKK
ncbi:MAG TPA: glycosyltransferase family 2 protein [Chitinophagaceae bacterium]|jgi:glycosyltransferase involved in cell wall biosynthesis|nr:glycosyltransferase family 2 protein [Chitinophagaceae bacterium]